MAATPIYRAIMLECERRRLQLGWPMWQVDEASGVQDGYYAKMLYADTPSGRQARWDMLQYVVQALFPEGFDVRISQALVGPLDEAGMKRKIRFAAGCYDRKSVRKLMQENGSKGGKARAEKLKPHQRRSIARAAARARWNKRELIPPCQ